MDPASPRRPGQLLLAVLAVAAVLGAGTVVASLARRADDGTKATTGTTVPGGSKGSTGSTAKGGSSTTVTGSTGSVDSGSTTTGVPGFPQPDPTTTTVASGPYAGWVDPASSGQPWPGAKTVGMLTFRGNPTRTWYGLGPVPQHPHILWSIPNSGGFCHKSSSQNVTKVWCGTGWTGQANLWERPDGSQWLMFGAYDAAFHFVDAKTGKDVMPSLPTGDINKGSASIDPDGYPLYYAGSRDNYMRVIALDRGTPTVLYKFNAHDIKPTLWNDDWDGAPVEIGDYLFEGGENSNFHIWKLNRGYGADGKVTVDPKLIFYTPGWDAQLLKDIGDNDVSIENSVAISGNVVYFANSGGLVQGWDLSTLKSGGKPTRVFRFWTGDDTDASVVVDKDGFLYVASEYQRFLKRAQQVGQLMKLDPRKPDNPLVWSIKDDNYRGSENAAGIWSTVALHKGVVIATTNGGRVLGVDQNTGALLWQFNLTQPVWQSPVVVDNVLIQGDCSGTLHAYDVTDPTKMPRELWTVKLDGCIEATPTVWKGTIYVGARGGKVYAIGDG